MITFLGPDGISLLMIKKWRIRKQGSIVSECVTRYNENPKAITLQDALDYHIKRGVGDLETKWKLTICKIPEEGL